jgi:hypothetical protein
MTDFSRYRPCQSRNKVPSRPVIRRLAAAGVRDYPSGLRDEGKLHRTRTAPEPAAVIKAAGHLYLFTSAAGVLRLLQTHFWGSLRCLGVRVNPHLKVLRVTEQLAQAQDVDRWEAISRSVGERRETDLVIQPKSPGCGPWRFSIHHTKEPQ